MADEAALQRLLDAARIDVARDARRRRRRAAELARGEATVVGVLRELADRRALVRLELIAGPTVSGEVRAVGRDVVVVGADGMATLVALRAIALVDAADFGRAAGDRPASHDVGLGEVLADLAGASPDVAVWLQGRANPVRGRLLGAGIDVVLLDGARSRPQASDSGTVTLPLAAVSAVRVA